ncbi:hypothetical protein B0H14DRAFT_3526247 [Mycena olivaceomarginata]|nr:hypothetical protein B0H14DRAFT_3526247 [Mycena olivaceomarginata]
MATNVLPSSLSSRNPFRPSSSQSNPWFDNTRHADTSSPPPVMTPDFPPTFIHINAPPAVRPYYPGARYIDDAGNVVSPPTTRPVIAHPMAIDDNGNFVPMGGLHAGMSRSRSRQPHHRHPQHADVQQEVPVEPRRSRSRQPRHRRSHSSDRSSSRSRSRSGSRQPRRRAHPRDGRGGPQIKPLSLTGTWKEDAKLDLNKSNYRTWSKTLWNSIAMHSGATRYLDPTEEAPSEARYPCAYRTWRDNDVAICAYISSSTVSTEHEHFEHHKSAAAIWAARRVRHTQ